MPRCSRLYGLSRLRVFRSVISRGKYQKGSAVMPSIYDQYQNLTELEQSYLRNNPHHAWALKSSKEAAYTETKKRFGYNGRNEKSDAFRHCFWSALLARDLGYNNALQFTNAHESSPKNPPKEKSMDLHNNSIGLTIGRTGGENAHLADQGGNMNNTASLPPF